MPGMSFISVPLLFLTSTFSDPYTYKIPCFQTFRPFLIFSVKMSSNSVEYFTRLPVPRTLLFIYEYNFIFLFKKKKGTEKLLYFRHFPLTPNTHKKQQQDFHFFILVPGHVGILECCKYLMLALKTTVTSEACARLCFSHNFN